MSYSNLAELLDDATSRFTTLMSDIHAQGRTARVVLTGGTAGIALLERLVEQEIDWSRVEVFFGDERNVAVSHPDSNEGQARAALLDKVDIPEENIHGYGLDGGSMDAAVSRYRTVVGDGGFDLHLLGMGGEGHINSLFPHTDAVRERDALVVAVTDSPKPPAQRATLTLPAVQSADQVWLLVSGTEKAEAASHAADGAAAAEAWPVAGAIGRKETVLFATEDATGPF
ncbi:6-phosphogluconolactonase [Corynebacterium fournieri]|uniref:6-phosphogluconolactonase n=1 Tax=Corynebacterium fournieri TaxID=1852390 RepID=UPI000A2F5454|nr:6-phosphogluconolactonase [Corynebacterium fournieri]WJY97632.1 6-phosphogluconolactonase [Corynebacterium fournieri]